MHHSLSAQGNKATGKRHNMPIRLSKSGHLEQTMRS